MRRWILVFLSFALATTAARADDIHDAAKAGDLAAITAALEAGADVNQTDGLATALSYAVIKKQNAAAELLIVRGADVNAISTIGGTPLLAAVMTDQIEVIQVLLENGADPNIASGIQMPLHGATKKGCLDCVIALVQAGADVNARTGDAFARTPIHLAKSYNHTEIITYLMDNGVVIPRPEPIPQAMAAADAEQGQIVFGKNCDGCHNNEPGKGIKTGPNLWGVVGRDKGSVADFKYSQTLQSLDGVWSEDDLNALLTDPVLTTPGVLMEIPGIPDATDRANLIAYLQTLRD